MLKDPNENYIIFESLGEVSRDIMGTAVTAALHREYPDKKIIVTTLHPEVWLHNPDVYRFYKPDATPYFYDDYMSSDTVRIFRLDPYQTNDFISGEKHLIDAWCTLCGVERKGAMPKLFFTAREHEIAREVLGTKKPTFLLHIHGEAQNGMPYPYLWSRNADGQMAQEVVDAMNKKGYRVFQIAPMEVKALRGAERLTFNNRLLMCAVGSATKRLLIDSFPQHAAAVEKAKSVVLWNTLDYKRHGYDFHHNILPRIDNDFKKAEDSFIEPFRVSRVISQHAPPPSVNQNKLYTTADVLFALEKI